MLAKTNWKKTCPDCGAAFEGGYTQMRCASCARKRQSEQVMRHQQSHQASTLFWKEHVPRERFAGKRPAQPVVCERCGKNYWGYRTRRDFCSSACSGRAKDERASIYRPDRDTYKRGAWRKLRAWVLAAEPHCWACGAKAKEVDHIVPIRAGGDYELNNLQPLCSRCHSGKTNREFRRNGTWKGPIEMPWLKRHRAGIALPLAGAWIALLNQGIRLQPKQAIGAA